MSYIAFRKEIIFCLIHYIQPSENTLGATLDASRLAVTAGGTVELLCLTENVSQVIQFYITLAMTSY